MKFERILWRMFVALIGFFSWHTGARALTCAETIAESNSELYKSLEVDSEEREQFIRAAIRRTNSKLLYDSNFKSFEQAIVAENFPDGKLRLSMATVSVKLKYELTHYRNFERRGNKDILIEKTLVEKVEDEKRFLFF